MRRAGLTHGGFYAHFRDKAELVGETCAAAFAGAVPNLDRIASLATPEARARLLIDSYLSRRHRDDAGTGCHVVTVGTEMTRLRGSARARYAMEFGGHLDRLATALRLDPDPGVNRRRVLHLMSSLVGALLFARAIEDPAESDAMLLALRAELREEFCSPKAVAPRPVASTSHGFIPAHDFLSAL